MQVSGGIGGKRPNNCFVYERPLEPGQAVQRVLRALATGIAFDSVTLTSIEVHNNQPVLFFRAPYRPTLAHEDPGLLLLALNPRSDFPVLCLHDEPGYEAEFLQAVRKLVKGFVVTREQASPPLMREIWKLERQGQMVGFSTRRIWYERDATRALTIASRFEPTDRGMETWDHAELDLLDASGLLQKEVVELEGTRVNFQISLRRAPSAEGAAPLGAVRYEYQGSVLTREVSGQFSTEKPLEIEASLYGFLKTGQSAGAALQYRPSVRLDGPSEIRFRFLETGQLESTQGHSTSVITLGEDGLPIESTTSSASLSATWSLLRREGTFP